jgi:hypothetical protein
LSLFGGSDTDKEMAESTKLLSPESEALYIKTFPKTQHAQNRYYRFLIKQLYRRYDHIIQDLDTIGAGKSVYLSYENAGKTLEFSGSMPNNPALSLQKI